MLMKFVRSLVTTAGCVVVAMPAFAWDTPQRGSQLRSELMNAVRPYAERDMGRPVQFVVSELRYAGNVAFAILEPQRPGGGTIRWQETRFFAEGDSQDFFDGLRIDTFLRYQGGRWQVGEYVVGATDVWYADPALCGVYRAVIPEFC